MSYNSPLSSSCALAHMRSRVVHVVVTMNAVRAAKLVATLALKGFSRVEPIFKKDGFCVYKDFSCLRNLAYIFD